VFQSSIKNSSHLFNPIFDSYSLIYYLSINP